MIASKTASVGLDEDVVDLRGRCSGLLGRGRPDEGSEQHPPGGLEVGQGRHVWFEYLLIHRSWISRIGTGLRKWCFSRPTLRAVTSPASSRTLRCFMTPKRSVAVGLELAERAAVTLEEPIQEQPPVGRPAP